MSTKKNYLNKKCVSCERRKFESFEDKSLMKCNDLKCSYVLASYAKFLWDAGDEDELSRR